MSQSLADHLDQIFSSRHSVRAFRPEPIEEDSLHKLFSMAQNAPSWCNIQPWRLALSSGDATRDLAMDLVEAAKTQKESPDLAFPTQYPEPYQSHRRACGASLYGAMNIERHDKEGRFAAWLRNYELFDAPHLVVLSRDKVLGEYATLDVGVWLGYFLSAAESLGIAACAMASVAAFPHILRKHFAIGDDELILCGIALGYEDRDAPANSARTGRKESALPLRRI